MTGNVYSEPSTPEEKHLRKMVEAVNQAAPRNLPADAVVCPCENEHRPVYPVRYAYSNLFGDKTAGASMPPPVKKLLELCPAQPDIEIYSPEMCTVEDTGGYSARLLRSGWVYVFEEGEYPTRTDTEGQLLIFKHTVTYAHNGRVYDETDNSEEAGKAVKGGDADEYFIPHARIYNAESQTTELKEQFPYLPYLPIKKDVITARFFFSDIPLSDYTLNKMIADPEFRASFMQEINLVNFDDNPYALELREEHIDYLVEEYKDEAQRFVSFVEQAKKTGADLPGGNYFAEITNTPDVTKGSEALLAQVKTSLDYDDNEKSSLVILHDPVGYQKDILALYSFVTAAYATFQYHWSYPNQVGHHLLAIKTHLDHPDISHTGDGYRLNEQFLDNIDMQGWQTYWPQIEEGYEKFEQLQQNIVRLYTDFLTNPEMINKIGGIKNYIDHVFLIQEQYESGDFWHREFFEEVIRYSTFHELLLSPLNSSKAGLQTLNLIFSVDKPEGEIWKKMCTIMILLISKEELRDGGAYYFKDHILPSLQSVLLICRDALGYAFTVTHAQLKKTAGNVRNITQAGIDYLAKKVLPAFLDIFGIRVNMETLQPMSGKQFMDWMDSLNGKTAPVKNAPGKIKKMLNWEARLRNPKVTHAINTIQYHYTSTGLPVDKTTFKNTLTFSSSLYSMLTGILGFYSAKLTAYDRNNPLNTSAINIYCMQMSVYLISITEGIITTRQAAGIYMNRVTYPPLRHILMKIRLPEVTSGLGKLVIKNIGYVVALLGAALPMTEFFAELDKKNHVAAVAKFSEAAATLALSIGVAGVGKANAIIEGVAVISSNPIMSAITTYAWQIVLGAVLTLVISLVIYNIFKTDKFEELLKNCFWGNGTKYFAGGYSTQNNNNIDRPNKKEIQLEKYIENFERYTAYYQIELQEFLNFFFMPQVKITSSLKVKMDKIPDTPYVARYMICYQFRLANFQCGLSDIEYQLVKTKQTVMYASQMPAEHLPSKQDVILQRNGYKYIVSDNHTFNQAFEQALTAALQNTLLQDGEFNFSFEVDAGMHAGEPLKNNSVPSLFWYYLIDRIKGDIAPLRYRNGNLQDKIYGHIDDKGME